MTASPVAEPPTQDPEHEPGLPQPWRRFPALAEAVVVLVAAVAAGWCWQRGVVHVALPIGGGHTMISTRYAGGWLTAAAGLATFAVLLALDVVRQFVLGMRTSR